MVILLWHPASFSEIMTSPLEQLLVIYIIYIISCKTPKHQPSTHLDYMTIYIYILYIFHPVSHGTFNSLQYHPPHHHQFFSSALCVYIHEILGLAGVSFRHSKAPTDMSWLFDGLSPSDGKIMWKPITSLTPQEEVDPRAQGALGESINFHHVFFLRFLGLRLPWNWGYLPWKLLDLQKEEKTAHSIIYYQVVGGWTTRLKKC